MPARATRRLVKRGLQRAHKGRRNAGGIAKPDLCLGRMHVDINLMGWQLDMGDQAGEASFRHKIAVGSADNAEQPPILHRAMIDEEDQARAGGAIEGWQPRQHFHLYLATLMHMMDMGVGKVSTHQMN